MHREVSNKGGFVRLVCRAKKSPDTLVMTHCTWCEPARGGAGGVFMPIARRAAEEYPGSTWGAHLY